MRGPTRNDKHSGACGDGKAQLEATAAAGECFGEIGRRWGAIAKIAMKCTSAGMMESLPAASGEENAGNVATLLCPKAHAAESGKDDGVARWPAGQKLARLKAS
ncbi:hypothetical protein GUJ93_ZPchr0010g10202 [Zizania palustris]|uniref:Uncharacterized protein n=1 Tax=Zizania palustris TaxID=103762 RepID=A0A8J5WAM0_ZIZPA|nr:hypothetical protein GUJ93_ZPchr0010g10202 [Zizania palustris]